MEMTPMMQQYLATKEQNPGAILFFRLGDFYEMFFEDAKLVSKELGLTLTSRSKGQDAPMCGVPYHAAETYVNKLVKRGYKVAIAEQIGDPKAKGLTKREVIKVVTPGTILSESALQATQNNYIALIYETGEKIVLAGADISTGECFYGIYEGGNRLQMLLDELYRLMMPELLVVGKPSFAAALKEFAALRLPHCSFTPIAEVSHHVEDRIVEHFDAATRPAQPEAKEAVATLLDYLHETVRTDLTQLNQLMYLDASENLVVDTYTLRNLEITRNLRDGGKKNTLLDVLDFTETAMGSRLLKKWLEYPLLSIAGITQRLDAVGELVGDVEPPAGCARAQPALDDGVVALNNVVNIALFQLIDCGQVLDAPPGVVLVGEGVEVVPAVIGRLLALRRAEVVVKAVGVEIDALSPRMVEDTVEHHVDAALFRLRAEHAEVRFIAEQRVNALITGRVVAVVGRGLEDRAEVECRHTERGEVVELFRDPLQVTAEKVAARDLALGVRAVFGKLVPIFVQRARADKACNITRFSAAEAVGEDLIHHAAFEELRCLIVLVVDGELEHFALIQHTMAGIATLDIVTHAVGGIGEIIVVNAGILGDKVGGIGDVAVFMGFHVHGQKTLFETGAENHQHRRKVQRRFFRQANGELTALVPGDRTEVRLIRRIPTVVKITHTEMLLSLRSGRVFFSKGYFLY